MDRYHHERRTPEFTLAPKRLTDMLDKRRVRI
jgi:hypothetical protein